MKEEAAIEAAIDTKGETTEKTEEETDLEINDLMMEAKNSLLSSAILDTKHPTELFENSLRIAVMFLISVSQSNQMERVKDFAMLTLKQEML